MQLQKRILSVLLCALMLISVVPNVFAADDEDGSSDAKYENCAENEIIVMFSSGAVKDSKSSLKAARALDNVDFSTIKIKVNGVVLKLKVKVVLK